MLSFLYTSNLQLINSKVYRVEYQADTGLASNAVSMLAHRLRRWPNIETALD